MDIMHSYVSMSLDVYYKGNLSLCIVHNQLRHSLNRAQSFFLVVAL